MRPPRCLLGDRNGRRALARLAERSVANSAGPRGTGLTRLRDVTREIAVRLPDLIKDLTVEDGPHNVAWTRPEAVNKALRDFLAAQLRDHTPGSRPVPAEHDPFLCSPAITRRAVPIQRPGSGRVRADMVACGRAPTCRGRTGWAAGMLVEHFSPTRQDPGAAGGRVRSRRDRWVGAHPGPADAGPACGARSAGSARAATRRRGCRWWG